MNFFSPVEISIIIIIATVNPLATQSTADIAHTLILAYSYHI